MPEGVWVGVARTRHRELPTRMALAVFIGGSAMVLAPSVWPIVWFVAVAAGQAFDDWAFRPLRENPKTPPSEARQRLVVFSTALNTTLYSMLAVYVWLYGGEAGHVFAMVQVAGSLLHVTLHLHAAPRLLLAAALPHTLYFLGLPALSAVQSARIDPAGTLVVFVASLLYLGHLVVSVRQNAGATAALRAANAEAARAQAAAEQASAAKSAFLATVSHEIRTPLNAVIGAAHLLKRTDLDVAQREHVAMLLDGGEVLLGIVNDVLDMSKIEAGKMTLQPADFELRAKLLALGRLWAPRAEDKGLTLRLEGLDDVPERVRTDPLRLQQILFNLISNAVKFTDEGEVVLRSGRTDGSDGARVWFEVVDTGCGLSPEALERVFDRFEQADRGVAGRHGGTGLGLSISRRLAELMGGALTARSVEGEGSVFRLEIPLEEIAAAIVEPAAFSAGPADCDVCAEGLQILVAEDHEVNRRVVALMLEPLGWTLTMAVDGGEAVRLAAERPFDVILMDMQMPVMNGPDAARAIRGGGGPNARTPVVALTANALDHHRQAWAEVGAAGFVAKPVDPAALTVAVLAAAAGRDAVLAQASAA